MYLSQTINAMLNTETLANTGIIAFMIFDFIVSSVSKIKSEKPLVTVYNISATVELIIIRNLAILYNLSFTICFNKRLLMMNVRIKKNIFVFLIAFIFSTKSILVPIKKNNEIPDESL